MARVRLSQAAREDLRDIRIHSKSAFGVAVARDYLGGIRGVFSLLRDRPLAGAADNNLSGGLRTFGHRSHRLYYRVDDRGVEIIRILHVSRDAPRAMG